MAHHYCFNIFVWSFPSYNRLVMIILFYYQVVIFAELMSFKS